MTSPVSSRPLTQVSQQEQIQRAPENLPLGGAAVQAVIAQADHAPIIEAPASPPPDDIDYYLEEEQEIQVEMQGVNVVRGVTMLPAEIDALFAYLCTNQLAVTTQEKVEILEQFAHQNHQEAQLAEHVGAGPKDLHVDISAMLDRSGGARPILLQVENILFTLAEVVPNITSMDLSRLQLEELPYILYSFAAIKQLDLSHNNLKTITALPNPAKKAEAPILCGTVEVLNLAHNQITGDDAKGGRKFPAMPKLVDLNLSHNQVARPIQFSTQRDGSLGAPELQVLNLSGNPLFTGEQKVLGKDLIDYYAFDDWTHQFPKLHHLAVSQNPALSIKKLMSEKFPNFGVQQIGTAGDPDFVLFTKVQTAPDVRIALPKASNAASQNSKKTSESLVQRSPGSRKSKRVIGSPKGQYAVKRLPPKAEKLVQLVMNQAREQLLKSMGLGPAVGLAPPPTLEQVTRMPFMGQLPPEQEQRPPRVVTFE